MDDTSSLRMTTPPKRWMTVAPVTPPVHDQTRSPRSPESRQPVPSSRRIARVAHPGSRLRLPGGHELARLPSLRLLEQMVDGVAETGAGGSIAGAVIGGQGCGDHRAHAEQPVDGPRSLDHGTKPEQRHLGWVDDPVGRTTVPSSMSAPSDGGDVAVSNTISSSLTSRPELKRRRRHLKLVVSGSRQGPRTR